MEYFSYDVEKIATTSAFIQQREKIKLEAFQELFERFTAQFEKPKTHKGYRLFAIDGSSFSISRNSTDEKTYVKNGEDSKGYNFIHLNALYDLENRIYVGALIQNGRELNEKQALIDIVKNSHVEEKVIVIGDRNYESYNIFENVKEKNWNYIIRLKDIVYGKIDFFLRKLSCKKQTLKVQVFLLLLFCQRQKYLMKKSIF